MDSLRSTHARLAALVRHYGPDDPEVIVARRQLARCKAETSAIRARISSLPPSVCARLLASAEGPSA